MSKRPILDAIVALDNEIKKAMPGRIPQYTLQLPYVIRHVIAMEASNPYNHHQQYRGKDSFTLYGNIIIEPTKDEAEERLRAKVERAKQLYEDAQKEYDTIIGGNNG